MAPKGSSSSQQQQQELHDRHCHLPTLGLSVTGDKELLWSCLRQAASLEDVLSLAEAAGFHSVVLPWHSLLWDGAGVPSDFGAILGQLSVFGAVAAEEGQPQTVADCAEASQDLASRELRLVQLGLTKRSINAIRRHLQLARNIGRAVCLVIDNSAPAGTSVGSVIAPLRESRGILTPTVMFGTRGGGGTVMRVDQLADPSADEHEASVSGLKRRCDFADVMLVAYGQTSGGGCDLHQRAAA